MNITTIKELKKHIGEYLAFESHSGSQAGHLAYVWIQKLQKVGTKRDNIPIINIKKGDINFNSRLYIFLKIFSGIFLSPT